MNMQVLTERNVVLRLEFSIADAVHQRGLLPVIGAAVAAWMQRPPKIGKVPPYLRADLGLPPEAEAHHWHSGSLSPPPPDLFRFTR